MNKSELKSLCNGLTMRQVKSFCDRYAVDLRHSNVCENRCVIDGMLSFTDRITEDNPAQAIIVASLRARKLRNGESASYLLYVDDKLNVYVETRFGNKTVPIDDAVYTSVILSEYSMYKDFITLKDYALSKYDPYSKGYYMGDSVEVDGLKVSQYTRYNYTTVAYDGWNQKSRHLTNNTTYVYTNEDDYSSVRVYTPYMLEHPEIYAKESVNGYWYLRSVLAEIEGQLLCKDNWRKKYFKCAECGLFHKKEDAVDVCGKLLCPECFANIEESGRYVKCDHCGKYAFSSDLITGIDGKRYCLSCERDSVISYHGVDKRHYYKPIALPGESTDLYYGTEVETQGPRVNACLVSYENGDLFHCERDASIGDGFEIISQPMTLNYIKTNFERIKEMFGKLIDAGQKSHDTSCCGYHIHASKKAFKDEDAIYRAVAMVNYFRTNCEIIARRKNSSYYSYSNVPSIITKKKLKNGCSVYGHGVSVNLSNNNTVEFRIFKGTLNVNTYMATLEFVDNIIKYANSGKQRIKFSELLVGEYLPAYVETRSRRQNIDMDKTIDFAGYNQEEVKENLKKRWDLINAIKAYNADPANINKIKPEQLGFIPKGSVLTAISQHAVALGGAC